MNNPAFLSCFGRVWFTLIIYDYFDFEKAFKAIGKITDSYCNILVFIRRRGHRKFQ